MTVDLNALITELETNPAFDTDVRDGHNAKVLNAMHIVDNALDSRWHHIPRDDFLAAVINENLTQEQLAAIGLLIQDGHPVAMQKLGVRTWVLGQGFSTLAITEIRRLGLSRGRPVDAFLGENDVNLDISDFRQAIREVAKSYINNPRSRPLREQKINAGSIRTMIADFKRGLLVSQLSVNYSIPENVVTRILNEHGEAI